MERKLSAARELLARAGSVTVLTGAGISAESGVPVFRKDGKTVPWRDFEDPTILSHVDSLARDLKAVWEWFRYRQGVISSCEPNPGHQALARMQDVLSGFTLITQNVDGLHQRAGSRDVIELHGNIWQAKCMAGCGFRGEVRAAPVVDGVPRCACGATLRPGVVMFGDPLEEASLRAAAQATRCEVCLIVGTSGVVWPAAGLPLEAKAHGATLIEVNPESTPLTSHADLVLRGKAGGLLHALLP